MEVQNPTNTKMHFLIFWFNHPFNYPHPFAMGGGELLPQKIFKLSSKYPDKTKWSVQWIRNKKTWIKFFSVPAGISKEEAIDTAAANENVIRFTDGKTIVKTIYVPGKLVNIVVK